MLYLELCPEGIKLTLELFNTDRNIGNQYILSILESCTVLI